LPTGLESEMYDENAKTDGIFLPANAVKDACSLPQMNSLFPTVLQGRGEEEDVLTQNV